MTIANDTRYRRLLLAGLAAGICLLGTSAAPLSAADDKAELPAASADLPDAKAVLANALRAMGGREALENIQSSAMKGNISVPMGSISLESFSASSDRFLIKQVITGMGEVSFGSDGETTWSLNPMAGYQLVPDEVAQQMREQASMHTLLLRFEKEFKDFTTVERADFHGKDCFKLRLLDKDDQEQFAYFDAQDHFMAGMEVQQQSPMGPMRSTMRFEDWKEHGDIKMFTRMLATQGTMEMTLQITDLEFNKVDEEIFALPAEVQRMVDQSRDEAKPGEDEDAEDKPAS